jgi:hypothetical protein
MDEVAKGLQSVEEADWISVSDLARLRGCSHQAVSKRVRALAKHGQLPTRRVGKAKLIHVPTFDALAAATLHPGQELRNFHHEAKAKDALDVSQEIADAITENSKPSGYTSAVEREKHAKAALAEMQLAQKRRELVDAREIEAAAIATGTAIAQRVAALKSKAGQLYAAAKGGEEALAIELTVAVNKMLAEIADDMAQISEHGKPAEWLAKSANH